MRLKNNDQPFVFPVADGFDRAADLHRMMAVVGHDRSAVSVSDNLLAAVQMTVIRQTALDLFHRDTGFIGGNKGGQGVIHIVFAQHMQFHLFGVTVFLLHRKAEALIRIFLQIRCAVVGLRVFNAEGHTAARYMGNELSGFRIVDIEYGNRILP